MRTRVVFGVVAVAVACVCAHLLCSAIAASETEASVIRWKAQHWAQVPNLTIDEEPESLFGSSAWRFFESRVASFCENVHGPMSYRPFGRGIERDGRPFNITRHHRETILRDYCHPSLETVHIKAEHVVFVTAVNEDNFEHGVETVRSFLACAPGQKVIVRDLGMTESQANFFRSLCGVAFAAFDFDEYPSFVRFLDEGRFKPLIIHETIFDKHNLLGELPHVVVWLDPEFHLDCRPQHDHMIDMRWHGILRLAANKGAYSCSPWQDVPKVTAYKVTPWAMYEFFPNSYERMTMFNAVGSECVVVSGSRAGLDSVLIYWVACALDPRCMLDKTIRGERWWTGSSWLSKGPAVHDCRTMRRKQEEYYAQLSKSRHPVPCVDPDAATLRLLMSGASARHDYAGNMTNFVTKNQAVLHGDNAPNRFYDHDVLRVCHENADIHTASTVATTDQPSRI